MDNDAWGDALTRFLTHLQAGGCSPDTIYLRSAQLRRFARDVGAPTPGDVTLELVEAWLARQSWKAETRRSHRAAVRTFFAWAVRAGIVPTNPALELRRIKVPAPTPRPVPEDQYRFALLVGDPDERLMVWLAGGAGLRRGEVARVHTRDVVRDLTGWSLIVHGKGDKTRLVPLKDDLAEALLARPAGYIFPGRVDGHISAKWVGKRVGRLLPEGYTMHKLRTRFAARAYAISRDLAATQDLLGHASPATTRIYVPVPDDHKRAIVNAV